MTPESAIYVVATPIGNLDDLTLRAIKVLKNVDIIAAEDTRRARQLLQHIGRDKAEVISYFDHVEREKAPQLVSRLLENNLSLALISDAGTPCISDPGYHLVREAKKRGVTVHPVPGPSAMTALVSASGLPSDRLMFIGFLPNKKMALEREVANWKNYQASIVFYEAPRRLKTSLTLIHKLYPNAEIVIGRELTKLHEEIILTDPKSALDWCNNHEFLKGEAVVMVRVGDLPSDTPEAKENKREALIAEAREQFRKDATLKDLLGLYRDRGLSRSELYQLLLEAKGFYGNEK